MTRSKYSGQFKKGDRLEHWKVLSPEIKIDNEAKIKCKCTKCNNTVRWVSCYSLTAGTSTKCLECGNSMKKSNNPAWKGYKEISGKFFSRMEHHAKTRDLDVEITKKDIWELYRKQRGKCKLTNLPIVFGKNASLDRIDSNKDYTKNNIQLVHKLINKMKNDISQEDFIYLCKHVAKNH